ncbi:MAG: ErfK/YbiS/YcfS/YnhG family protein [Hyphomicrobiales bacterium]|nr:ErfK/YbiS/YcfS/YnhG family protein [Hyphomicrobiales bacterium]
MGLALTLAAPTLRAQTPEPVETVETIEAVETPREASPALNVKEVAEAPAPDAVPAPEAPAVAAEAEIDPNIVPMPPEVAVDLTPAPVAAPATPVVAEQPAAPVLSPVQVALKATLEARLAERVPTAQRRVREAVAHVYETRGWQPLWLGADNGWTGQARAAIARLERAADDALDLRSAPAPVLRGAEATALAAADLALSDSVATYARQASGARIDPRAISSQITVKPEVIEPSRSLVEVAAAADAGATLEGYNPQHRGYRTLRDKLAELRHAAPAVAQRPIPMGPVLKAGMKDDRVPLIRARFGLDQAVASDDLVYDTRVAEAVAGFQKANGIPASGTLTARTIAALSGGHPARLEDEIIANMERWRWMPRDMGHDRIEVNIPDYKVRVYRGDTIVHEARVVVGKPQTPTPVFSNSMQFLIVNPYWNVPPSIIKNEMLPKLKEDPTYLTRLGYEVIQRKGQMIVRQPPGERNALGWIKFMFPNEHSVYLHDTPSRSLFANARRAYSHGCVRVDQPFALAEIVLGQGWTEERVKKLKGGAERMVKMPKPLPIHIGYFSAFVDETGKLQLREDIYGYSGKVKAALGLSV